MGYIFRSEISKIKQQWKICHNFQAWSLQDLPHLTQFCTQQASEWAYWIVQSLSQDWRCEKWKPSSRESSPQPCIPRARDLVLHLANDSSDLVFPPFSAPWWSGWLVGHMHRYLEVAFPVYWLLVTTPCAPYPSKQQRPTAWISALLYQCLLLLLLSL